MKKILYISSAHFTGGAERSLLTTLFHIDRKKVSPWVLCPPNPEFFAEIKPYNIPVGTLTIPPFKPISTNIFGRKVLSIRAVFFNLYVFLKTIGQTSRILSKEKIDLVHSNDLLGNIFGGIAAKIRHIPIIWHIRDNVSAGLRRKLFDLLASLFADIIVAVSGRIRNTLTRSRHKAVVVYNGVDLKSFGTAEPDKVISGDGFSVGMVGRISDAKGFDIFLTIAAKVLKMRQDVLFYIIGGPKTPEQQLYYEELRQMAVDLGVAEKVFFLGERTDMPEIYTALDIVLLPSLREALPRTLIEAQACETVCIASDVGGVGETIIDGKNGFVIADRHDIDEFSDRIQQLLNDPKLMEDMRKAGKKLMKERFDIDNIVKQLETLYERV